MRSALFVLMFLVFSVQAESHKPTPCKTGQPAPCETGQPAPEDTKDVDTYYWKD